MKTSNRAASVGALVCEARDEAGLNNSSLAREAGLERRTIVRITNGQNEPDLETLERIARATKKPLDFFRVDQGEPSVALRAAAENLVEVLVEQAREAIRQAAAEAVAEIREGAAR
ncbi:MAG TPA: helix-turn-helix transcriptional regulator [Gaiellaceae bacterium]|nr:helix-turn-helix transcriptional regulator [Gaiellaceae bacterium]